VARLCVTITNSVLRVELVDHFYESSLQVDFSS